MKSLMMTLAAAMFLVVSTAAVAQKRYDPGATDTSIKLGMPMPLSGPVSSLAVIGKVNEGYFRMLNERGGINGRQVTLITYDDQYSPPRALEVTRKMVEQDEVLAIHSLLGTATGAATAKYLTAKKVPLLFISTGAEMFNQPKKLPYVVPLFPDYVSEGRVYAKAIMKNNPDAKIAVFYQNDDFGKTLLRGLKEGLGEKASSMIVGEASYEVSDPTVDSQIVQLKSSGADVVVYFSTIRYSAQAIRKVGALGWKPRAQYISQAAAFTKQVMEPAGTDNALGIMSSAYLKDPSQALWSKDPETLEFKAFMAKYVPGVDPQDATTVVGYVNAQLMANVLTRSGDDLTRANVMKQALSLRDVRVPMMLPGMAMNTSETNHSPVSKVQMVRFDGKEFAPTDAVFDLR